MNGFFYENFIPLNFREATCEYLMNAASFESVTICKI